MGNMRGTGPVYQRDSATTSSTDTAPAILTVLRSASGRRQSKRITPTGVISDAKESRWHWHEITAPDFASLSHALTELEDARTSLVVLGIVAPEHRDAEIISRTKVSKPNKPASLIDAGSRVVHFDIDNWPMSAGSGWHDPEAVARHTWKIICERVPTFTGVSVHWQASSSAGTPGKADLVKLHLWALLDQPIDEERRRALLLLAGADPSLASINQPNYTAPPAFEGVADPLADVGRSGAIVAGRDFAEVDLIEFPATKIAERKERAPNAQRSPPVDVAMLQATTTAKGERALQRACEAIRNAVHGSRNPTINRKAFLIGGLVAGGQIAYAEAEAALMQAGQESGHARYVEAIQNGLTAGLGLPIGETAGPGEVVPFHPAPAGDRDAEIKAHGDVIDLWAARAIPERRAVKEVARRYFQAGFETPEQDDPNRKSKNRGIARARQVIRRAVQRDFALSYLPSTEPRANPPRVMLTGAQGVGKTARLVGRHGSPGRLHEAQGLVSVMYLPDLAKAEEARDDYEGNAPAGAPLAILVRGRGAADPARADVGMMCELHEEAGKLAQQGVSVKKALCKDCPYQLDCGYLRQEAEIEAQADAPSGLVLFGAHEYGFLRIPGNVTPDLEVFDERPRDMGVERAEVALDALSEVLQFEASPHRPGARSDGSDQADAHAANLRWIRPLQIALRNAAQDHPGSMLAALRATGIDRERVQGAIAGLQYFQDQETAKAMQTTLREYRFAEISGGKPFDLKARLKATIEDKTGKIVRPLITIFEALLIEIERPRDEATALTVDAAADGSHKVLKAVRLKRLQSRGKVPFLHLDGTGDHDMAERLFGAMDHEQHRVERTPAGRADRVVQVVGNGFSNEMLIGGRKVKGEFEPYTGTWKAKSEAVRADVKRIVAAHPGCLVVGNKSVIEALAPESLGAHAAHYGALRGRNEYEGCDTVIVVGREQPSGQPVEEIARAYAARDAGSFKTLAGARYPTEDRGITLRDGLAQLVEVAHHPDPWGDRVLRQIRDSEIVQAIDRIRPIFKPQATPIKIIVLAEVALDLTVDEVTDWQDYRHGGTRVHRALERDRVVPLGGAEAFRLQPTIWDSQRTAEREIAAFIEKGLTRHSVNRTSYLPNGALRNLVVATYTTAPQAGGRAKERRALIASHRDDARAVLERLTGPLRTFDVVEVIAEDEAAQAAALAREERAAIAEHDGGLSRVEAEALADASLGQPVEVRSEGEPAKPPAPRIQIAPVRRPSKIA